MLQSDLINSYQGTRQIDRMYKAGEIIYEKDLDPVVFETNFIQCTNWAIQYDPGRAYLAEVITEPVITKPAIISGHTMTSWGVGANIAWPDAKLALMENDGMIDFGWEPEYTGVPSQDVTLFETSSPKIAVTHNSDGTLEAKFYDFGGALIKSVSAAYVAAEKVRVRIDFQFDETTNNELTIMTDDTVLVTELAFADIDRGDATNCTITDFMPCAVKGEGGRGSRLRIHAELNPMTLEGVPMTLEGVPMYLGA